MAFEWDEGLPRYSFTRKDRITPITYKASEGTLESIWRWAENGRTLEGWRADWTMEEEAAHGTGLR